MPELPEVEQLVVGVRAAASGATFVDVTFFREDIREPLDKRGISDVILDQKITQVTRRGKYMLIHTKRGALGIHLGMSGRFIVDDCSRVSRLHTHVVFSIQQKTGELKYLHFVDPRRFGRVFPATKHEAESLSHTYLKNLGVEPLELGSNLWKHLFDQSRKRSTAIKTFLMDSSVLVGVGNIYASESLWRAKISPLRLAKDIDASEMKRLAKEIIKTLSEAIAAGGTTFRDYRNSDDKPGSNQDKLAVYERDTKPCKRCKAPIEKAVQAGRSTYFCAFCQN